MYKLCMHIYMHTLYIYTLNMHVHMIYKLYVLYYIININMCNTQITYI